MIIPPNFPEGVRSKSCSVCAESFLCGPESKTKSCWCEDLPHVPLPGNLDQDCLCPKCLAEAIPRLNVKPKDAAKTPDDPPPLLIEGQDFYWEAGAMVFTAGYHLRRGHCCENGCRHCPYKDVAMSNGARDPK